jgi:NADPH:quinone reductase-like Zn-dependent oxidoreductase
MSFGSEHIDDECTGRALAFTSHVAPPKHVPPNAVLVRVAAVGLDGVDARLTAAHAGAIDGSHSGHPEVGWIPGRSIVGRAVEIGSAVKEDWIRKGEWLVGLLDAQKVREFLLYAYTMETPTDRR